MSRVRGVGSGAVAPATAVARARQRAGGVGQPPGQLLSRMSDQLLARMQLWSECEARAYFESGGTAVPAQAVPAAAPSDAPTDAPTDAPVDASLQDANPDSNN